MTWGESLDELQDEIDSRRILNHELLATLAHTWDWKDVLDACEPVLGFPAELVTRTTEAVQIRTYLENRDEKKS